MVTRDQVGKTLRVPGGAFSVAFSPNGAHIVSGSHYCLCVWDAVTGQLVSEALSWHKDFVNSVAFSPDGTSIVSGSNDKTIRVWNLMMSNTYPTCPQLFNDWFSIHKELTQSYILWIPHSLRNRYFTIYPFDIVINTCAKISVQFEGASWGLDWPTIKK